jgi:hypothetical protein
MLPTTDLYLRAQKVAGVVDHIMADELRLQPPACYWLTEDGPFTWLLAVMDVQNLNGPIGKYTNESTRHYLSTAVGGLPVALSNSSGLRYAVLLSGRPQLPRTVTFPGMPDEADVIRFGVGLRGPVELHAGKIINMIVGGSQDSGKSNLLRLVAHTARRHGSKLYLADPVAHTFNPDVWDRISAHPVAGSKADLLRALEHLQAEIAERTVLFRAAAQARGGLPPEDIAAYNQAADPLPRIYFIVDEANSYLGDRAVQERIADPARVGRKWGIHFVLAAHNWRSEDISRGLSAMFPTRLCLRVADDTSGRVTLDDHRWGRQAMKFRTPGRAVLKRDRYETVQLYRMPGELEREWLSDTRIPAALSDLEQSIVAFAVEHGGEFRFREIAAGVEGTSEWQVRKLAEVWTDRGWLERGRDATSPRRVTPRLAELAGIALTGAQASQGITGGSQAAGDGSQGLSQALTRSQEA